MVIQKKNQLLKNKTIMSHFSVMVINSKGLDDVDAQLAPFNENNEVPEYQAEVVAEEEFARFREHYTSKEASDYDVRNANGEYATRDMSKYAHLSDKELYEKFGDDWNGGEWGLENGEWVRYSTYNPDSKWDWYEVGGRWAGFLKVKNGVEHKAPNFSWGWSDEEKETVLQEKRVDQARKRDIDFEKMISDYLEKRLETYRQVIDAYGGIPQLPKKAWNQCKDKDEYWNQPEMKKWSKVMKEIGLFMANISTYACTEEEFINRERDQAEKGCLV